MGHVVPVRLALVILGLYLVMWNYYHRNCVQEADGSWVSKDMYYPRDPVFDPAELLFGFEGLAKPFWMMPTVPPAVAPDEDLAAAAAASAVERKASPAVAVAVAEAVAAAGPAEGARGVAPALAPLLRQATEAARAQPARFGAARLGRLLAVAEGAGLATRALRALAAGGAPAEERLSRAAAAGDEGP